jgi:hypothetical protein
MVDLRLEKPSFQCNCKSRKNPCKHILAVLLLLMESSVIIQVNSEPPEDVARWLDRRTNRSVSKIRTEEEEEKLTQQRNKNRAARLQQMAGGLEELEKWLYDVMKEGVASLYHRPQSYWKEWAAQMTNAKMGNLAKRIERMPIVFQQTNWHELFFAELGDLYLIVRGFRQLDQLPDGMQQELFNTLGVNINKKELLALEGVQDEWWVLAQRQGVEDKLRFQRLWLYGKNTNQFALLLEYAWQDNPFEYSLQSGQVVAGELVFYPANFRQRATFKTFQNLPNYNSIKKLRAYPKITLFFDDYARAIAKNPWLIVFPVALENVIPQYHEEQLILIDQSLQYIPAKVLNETAVWQLIAISGGHPIAVFGEWEKGNLTILSVYSELGSVELTF